MRLCERKVDSESDYDVGLKHKMETVDRDKIVLGRSEGGENTAAIKAYIQRNNYKKMWNLTRCRSVYRSVYGRAGEEKQEVNHLEWELEIKVNQQAPYRGRAGHRLSRWP